MPKILVLEPNYYSKEALEIYSGLGETKWESGAPRPITDFAGDTEIIVLRLAYRLTAADLEKFPNLKVIGTSTTGLDHLAVEAATERGIKIVSLKGETSFLRDIHATSEHTFTILLGLLRRMREAMNTVEALDWRQDPLMGRELHGRTIGLIGFGRIGVHMAAIAKGFGMRVLATDPNVSAETMRAAGVEPVSMDELLAQSDIVSLHASLSPENVGLVSADSFSKMKQGVIFVNTARGQMVDEKALLNALESGMVAGAALDVLDGEERINQGSAMIEYVKTHPNVVITPHIAGTTRESLDKTQVFIAQKIASLYV